MSKNGRYRIRRTPTRQQVTAASSRYFLAQSARVMPFVAISPFGVTYEGKGTVHRMPDGSINVSPVGEYQVTWAAN